jgi:hypothetical protein
VKPSDASVRFSVRRLGCGAVGLLLTASLKAQYPPGVEFAAGTTANLALDPAGLATYAAILPPAGASAGIRYQLDVAWRTDETTLAGVTHDSITVSLQSLDGSRFLTVLGIDALGLQVFSGSGVDVLLDPSSRPQDLAFRVYFTPPSGLLVDGSWAVFDLADTGPLGGSSAVVSVALVPEPGSVALGLLGLGWLGWQVGLRFHPHSRSRGKELRQ